MEGLIILQLAALLGLAGLPGCGSLKMMNLTAPRQLVFGQSAPLKCNYDLEGSQLYSVKWYKNGQEFFRYMPSMDEQFAMFNIPGVHVFHPSTDPSAATYNQIQLNRVDMKTGGIFRCEVSNEYPDFHTVSQSVDLRVVAIPSGPDISPEPHTLALGDRLEVNCTVRKSLPRPSLLWYLNRVPASKEAVREVHLQRVDGTEDVISILALTLRRNHFLAGRLQLKCTAILETFFFKSSSLVVLREGGPGPGGPGQEGKILGLFDDDSYREREEQDSVRTAWTSAGSSAVTPGPSSLLLLPMALLLLSPPLLPLLSAPLLLLLLLLLPLALACSVPLH